MTVGSTVAGETPHTLKPGAVFESSDIHKIKVLGDTLTLLGPEVPQKLELSIANESNSQVNI